MELADGSSTPQATIVSGQYKIDVYYEPSSSNDAAAADGDTNFRCTLLARGEPFDAAATEITRLEDISIVNNDDIIACALSVALQDVNLLRQMGFLPPRDRQNEASEMPARLHGIMDNTPRAKQVVNKLVVAGLRKIVLDVVLEDADGWDVYDMAAGRACVFEQQRKLAHLRLQLGALICALIQIVVPAFLIYRGSTWPEEDLAWDVYIARLLF